ncbi:MAG: UbiA family prenyltransferase [Gemmatimonadales bacterium]
MKPGTHEAAGAPVPAFSAWIRSLRPHQWTKNLLLLLPALAAHLAWSSHLAWTLAEGLGAFSLVTSAGYVLNDLVDLPHDRLHPTKKLRPLAAGDLSRTIALLTPVPALATAALITMKLSLGFSLVLGTYLVIATAYTLALKRLVLVDVFTLAVLYTMRVMAGASLVGVPLSRWFLAFSVFFFLSLALVKRVVELQDAPVTAAPAPGRGYGHRDLAILTSLGIAAAAASALVYCLYISGDDVGRLYRHPDVLWIGLPMLLYWQARMWLLVARHEVHDDPLVFALSDPWSWVALVAFLLPVWAAAY